MVGEVLVNLCRFCLLVDATVVVAQREFCQRGDILVARFRRCLQQRLSGLRVASLDRRSAGQVKRDLARFHQAVLVRDFLELLFRLFATLRAAGETLYTRLWRLSRCAPLGVGCPKGLGNGDVCPFALLIFPGEESAPGVGEEHGYAPDPTYGLE